MPRARAIADADELLRLPGADCLPPATLLRGLPARPAPGAIAGPAGRASSAGLRAYRDGDDPRDIHWRSSARRGIPLVRENEDEEAREATVVLRQRRRGAAADPAAFERAVSRSGGRCASSWRAAASASGSRCAAARCAPRRPGAQTDALLRALALIAPDGGTAAAGPRRSATVRVASGSGAGGSSGGAGRAASATGGCGAHEVPARPQAGDLPAGAVGAGRRRQHRRAVADQRARCSLVACRAVVPRRRAATGRGGARSARPRCVRVAGAAVFAAIVWRIWRRICPIPTSARRFDLVLALLGYKLFYRRIHRDYVHISALTFLLVLVASTHRGDASSSWRRFAVYVVLAVWALILFHLRREMEENYLVKHSAQAPSQKVGVGTHPGLAAGGRARLLRRRPAVMAAAVVRRRASRSSCWSRASAPGSCSARRALSDSAAGLRRRGDARTLRHGAAAPRHAVVLRATLPTLPARDDRRRPRSDARGRALLPRRRLRRLRARALGPQPPPRAAHGRRARAETAGPGSTSSAKTAARATSLAGTERQEIEAVGIPASVLFARRSAVAFELPSTAAGRGGNAAA